ncbi:MAG: translation elongation factor-like protein [Anaerolineaceae bacterium]|nr:MAG: translation elongation factor-like protein [Anaerolineaceae bacterium]
MNGKKVGEVLRFYDHISVAVINLYAVLKVGDSVHFLGHGSDFQQDITSMQIENEPVQQAGKGELVAVKTIKPVKRGTTVYVMLE